MNQNPFVRQAYERCLLERKKESQSRTMTKEQKDEELKIQLEAMRNGQLQGNDLSTAAGTS